MICTLHDTAILAGRSVSNWIEKRMRSIAIREDLTDEWKDHGVSKADSPEPQLELFLEHVEAAGS